jgi:FtsP/CotA-like multicopper oxidase with cupredoxin domain
MSRAQRLTFLGIAAAIAIMAVVLLAGGDETDKAAKPAPTETPDATREPAEAEPQPTETPSATPTPKSPPLLQAGDEKALTFKEGDTVRFRVRNPKAEEVHVHGYDISKELEPGKTVTVSFKADITGIFEIELEGSGTLLAQLKVVP